MKNNIYYITDSQKKTLIKSSTKNADIYLAELNGEIIPTLNDYLKKIGETFKFPVFSNYDTLNLDAYLDWITDLSWLNAQEFVLIIRNFKLFLQDDLKSKKEILEDFKEVVLPWWEKEVEQYVVGGKAKPFNIYLVN